MCCFFRWFNCHLESSIQPEGVHHAFPLHLNLTPEQAGKGDYRGHQEGISHLL